MTIHIRRSHTIRLDMYGRSKVQIAILDTADDAAIEDAVEALSTMRLPAGAVRQSRGQIRAQLQRARKATSNMAAALEWEHEGYRQDAYGRPYGLPPMRDLDGNAVEYAEDTSGAQIIIRVEGVAR